MREDRADLDDGADQLVGDPLGVEDELAGDTQGQVIADEQAELQKRGHRLRESEGWGNLQVVIRETKSGVVQAASDPRGVGTAGIY